MKPLLTTLLAVCLVWALPLQAEQFEENVHYTRIIPEPPQGEPGDKIEVTEFFMYTCPHCYHFEPVLKAWKPHKSADIEVVQVPAMFGGAANLHAKVFYALQAIGEHERLHEPLFSAIHDKRLRLNTREAIEEFVESQGVDVEKFRAAMDSFAVAAKTNRATALMRRYGIRAVPKLVVDGRYRFERPVRHKEMPVLAEKLAEEIRQARKEDAR